MDRNTLKKSINITQILFWISSAAVAFGLALLIIWSGVLAVFLFLFNDSGEEYAPIHLAWLTIGPAIKPALYIWISITLMLIGFRFIDKRRKNG